MLTLIGLPGSCKSPVGRQFARRLQLPFFDSDHVIERRLGCSIRAFFECEGEARFRDLAGSAIGQLTHSTYARTRMGMLFFSLADKISNSDITVG